MRKIIRLAKRYWFVIAIPLAILAFKKLSSKAKVANNSKPGVTRPPIDGGGANSEDWGALSPAAVPEETTVGGWDNVNPFGGYGDPGAEPLPSADPYVVDTIKADSTWGEVPFAGGGRYY